MKDKIHLKKGSVYFYVGFKDNDLTVPNIQTWLYLGFDDEYGYLFESTSGEKEIFSFPDGISSNILDRKALSEWVLEYHGPKTVKKEYDYED